MTSPIFPFTDQGAAVTRQLQQLRKAPRVHDVVNLNTGAVSSERISRPLSEKTRAERLGRVFPNLGDSIFGPGFHLSARHPFIEMPFCWLNASSAEQFLGEADEIVWSQPANPGGDRGFLLCHFGIAANQTYVASFDVATFAWSNMTGHITLQATTGASASIPVTHQGFHHSIDLAFTPAAGGPAEVGFILEAGIQVLAFFGMSFFPQPPVVVFI